MKKLLILLTVCMVLCIVSAGTSKASCTTEQSEKQPVSNRQITIHTPSISTIQRCFHDIADAMSELTAEFSVESTDMTGQTAEDQYIIRIGW